MRLGKHLLWITQYYTDADEPGDDRQRIHVEAMLEAGFRVTVLTAQVRHLDRRLFGKKRLFRTTKQGALRIVRTYATPGYGTFGSRLRNYLSFAALAFLYGLFRAGRVDAVFASSPSLFAGAAGAAIAALRRVPFVLEVRDLWPESAVALGFLEHPVPIAMSRWLERALYRSAAAIVVLTRGIERGVLAGGGTPEQIRFVPNGVDRRWREKLRQARGYAREGAGGQGTVALYLGTINASYDFDLILAAARALPRVSFRFVGGGDRREAVERKAQGLGNVTFLPPIPHERLPQLLAGVDMGLVPLRDNPLFQGTLPLKVFELMAAAKPIVASVPAGELSLLIEESGGGIAVPPGDPSPFIAAIEQLLEHPEKAEEMGRKGEAYVFEHHTRQRLVEPLVSTIAALTHRS